MGCARGAGPLVRPQRELYLETRSPGLEHEGPIVLALPREARSLLGAWVALAGWDAAGCHNRAGVPAVRRIVLTCSPVGP